MSKLRKVSDLLLEFARPLLDAMGKPRRIDDLRSAIELASLCWNLPVLQRTGGDKEAGMRRDFDQKVHAMPDPVRSILLQMLDSREDRYGDVPFLVRAEVRGTALEDCRVCAEARDAPSPPPSARVRAFLQHRLELRERLLDRADPGRPTVGERHTELSRGSDDRLRVLV